MVSLGCAELKVTDLIFEKVFPDKCICLSEFQKGSDYSFTEFEGQAFIA